ncbi:MAG: discoidin domain-containing protein, partial [Planctomycetota bacterium]
MGGITHSATSYAPAQRLDFETTYYWRVDEVNAPPDSTVFEGNIWSFTTEPVGYPIDGANVTATASSAGQANLGPENTVNGSGLDENGLHSTEATDMWLSDNEPLGGWIQYEFDKVYKLHAVWVWNSNQVFEPLFGFGMKDVTVEYSTNGTDWTALAGVPEFAKAPGTPGYAHDTTVDFDSAVAKVVRLTATSNWGGVLPQFGLSEVRFFSIPVIAREPSPDSGATDVDMNVTLGWRAGRDAATHDVSLSTDEQAVIDGTAPAVSVADASYSSPLDLGSTYYWR